MGYLTVHAFAHNTISKGYTLACVSDQQWCRSNAQSSVLFCYVVLCFVMFCYVALCCAMVCRARAIRITLLLKP